ncbi:YolD-like family protein [Peribacillus deserti]|uniref:YolD-like family protein n=1 Tax=Peribacillus deserti TaxID=673318 RepID=A0A2N5M509_9BACI|nr:YolD-like family protein [Peribacillus deserti]PLT29448.1 YolD-like family protein [Peribacillus deserti]
MSLQDRGNIKWQGMIMPEHKAQILHLFHDDKKETKPVLDEYQLEEINSIILESLESEKIIRLKLHDHGYSEMVTGTVTKLDPHKRLLHLTDPDGTVKPVKFAKIIGATI